MAQLLNLKTSSIMSLPLSLVSITNHRRSCRCNLRNLKTKCSITENNTTIGTNMIMKPCKASEVLVEALERKGVTLVFAYPGGASLSIHQALSRSKAIKTVLPHHEQEGSGIDTVGPDMVKFAEACGISGQKVWRKSELRDAIEKMIWFDGPYLLQVVTPFLEGELPIMLGKNEGT